MATLHYSPAFCYLSSHKLSLFSSSRRFPLYLRTNQNKKCYCFRICASSSDKSRRGSRKVKSDEELCTDVREFLLSVGLPENHVPSMKELSENGRQDLANIVRRRGYKRIKQLLETSVTTNIDTGQNEILETLDESEGQDEKLKVLTNEPSSSEAIQEGDLHNCIETDEQLKLNEQTSFYSESSTLSLQEKVAKFIQHGELDAVEDIGFETSYQIHADRVDSNINSGDEQEPGYPNGYDTMNGNAFLSVQKVENRVLDNSFSRNSFISTEEKTSVDHIKDLDFENQQRTENQAEIKHLKFLLHQKELELTKLKGQIEKEKLALSALQAKAEIETSKAQNLLSQKETELDAAEESLSGLKEVEIEYSGDGETVELAGSFNGWHHKIKMDLLQSSTITDPPGSRASRVWRSVLWLYPGVYEMKFVVDGQWRIDPQRESVNRDNVHNNVLRVDR